jgi:hypothetical protein
MTQETSEILIKLGSYLNHNEGIRFGQALTNLGINEFADKNFPENANHTLRDIYNDSDIEILKRMKV